MARSVVRRRSTGEQVSLPRSFEDLSKRLINLFSLQPDPATREQLWEVPIGTQQDVDEAVVAAQAAFEDWSQVPMEKRKEMLGKFKDHYMSYTDEITALLCQETGKPVSTHY